MKRLIATIDASELYWAVLPRDNARVEFAFERSLPFDAQGLHCTASRLEDGRTLVVGIEPEYFKTFLATQGSDLWQVRPASLPTFLQGVVDAKVLEDLDLLHGVFESRIRQQVRKQRMLIVVSFVLVLFTFFTIGTVRRIRADQEVAKNLDTQTKTLAKNELQVLGVVAGNGDPAQTLSLAIRRLESQASGRKNTPCDAILEHLWQVWPKTIKIQVETLTVTPGRITLRAIVPDTATVQEVSQALARMPGWSLAPSMVENQNQGIRITLALHAGVKP